MRYYPILILIDYMNEMKRYSNRILGWDGGYGVV